MATKATLQQTYPDQIEFMLNGVFDRNSLDIGVPVRFVSTKYLLLRQFDNMWLEYKQMPASQESTAIGEQFASKMALFIIDMGSFLNKDKVSVQDVRTLFS